MKKRSISLVLVLMMCLSLFAGCQSSELKSYSDEPAPSGSPTGEETTTPVTKDYTPAFASYEPDQLMMTIDGVEVTWQELFYWYFYDLNGMESYGIVIDDWNAPTAFDAEQTYKEYVQNNAVETMKRYCALEAKAREKGITLSAEEKEAVQAEWQKNVTSNGGDEAKFIEYIGTAFLSKDIFLKMNEISTLYGLLLEDGFGKNGEKLSETEIIEEADEMGYVRANHILLSNKDAEGNALSDEQKAEKLAQAEKTLAELKAFKGTPQELEAKFKALAETLSEDGGKTFYADGYTYLPGRMVAEFETAAAALEDYAISEIVETEHGYHIILRLPLSTTVAVEVLSETEEKTLGTYVAEKMFNANTESWAAEAKIEYSKEYEAMDIVKVFSKATVKEAATEATATEEPAA